MRSSIKYRLLADVEIGSFLSGGVDSSLVSSIMQEESNKRIKTFSIGFEDREYDESIYAKEVAKYARQILEKDKEARTQLYKELKMKADQTVN